METINQNRHQVPQVHSAAGESQETLGTATLQAPTYSIDSGDDNIATNDLLFGHTTTGASERTTRQDGAHHNDVGVAASQRMANTDMQRILQYADLFVEVGNEYGFPPALLAAIASRETRGRNALYGDHGNGVGLMQVDIRFHEERATAIRNAATEREQTKIGIEFGATILKEMYDRVARKHPSWDETWTLRGAITAYNSGSGNVGTQERLDVGTTGNDYSADVWERAKVYAQLEEFAQDSSVVNQAAGDVDTQSADVETQDTEVETQAPEVEAQVTDSESQQADLSAYSSAETWDRHTNNRLPSLHPSVLPIARAFINIADKEHGIQLRVTRDGTLRTFAEQDALKRSGASQVGGGYSLYFYLIAVDVVEIKNGEALWTNPNWAAIGDIGKSLGFEWGGDWTGFVDKPHFQMTFGYTTSQLLARETGEDGYIQFSEEEIQNAQGDIQIPGGSTETGGETSTQSTQDTSVISYTVQSGETLQILANRFNTTIDSLKSLNRVHEFRTNSGVVLGFMAGQEIQVMQNAQSGGGSETTEDVASQPTTAVEPEVVPIDNATEEKIENISTQLYDAMHNTFYGTGWGTNEAAIYNALAKLNQDAVMVGKLMTDYSLRYGNDLIADLRAELSDTKIWGNQLSKAMEYLNLSGGGQATAPDLDRNYDSIPRVIDDIAPISQPGQGNAELDALLGDEDTRLTAEQIQQARTLIDDIQDEEVRGDYFMKLQWKVQYNNQRDSTVEENGSRVEKGSGGICNLTALAMCLEYLGIPNPKPEMEYEDALETIRQEKGFGARTGEGWEQVAAHMGAEVEFLIARGANANYNRQWWEANVGEAMRSGKSVMFSNRGHILRMQSMDENGIYVDDPYGRINVEETVNHDDQKRQWEEFNQRDGNNGDPKAGEDCLWEWEHMEKYKMWWLAAISK